MKRLSALVLVLVTLLFTALPVAAAEVENSVQPRFTYIVSASADLQIDGWGVASCTGSVLTRTSNPVKITIRLQRLDASNWTTVKDWSITGTGDASGTKYYAVYSGYTYRVFVIASVYDNNGNLLESTHVSKEFYY